MMAAQFICSDQRSQRASAVSLVFCRFLPRFAARGLVAGLAEF
jgi:hypothetical protein